MSSSNPAFSPLAMQSLVRECIATFGSGWSSEGARTLHERIEQAREAAEAAGSGPMAEQLLELSVYLCSLVEQEAAPSAASQARIAAMCSALAPGAAATSRPEQQETVSASRSPLVLLLVPPGTERLELAVAIGRRQMLVAHVDSLEALAQESSRRSPAAVLVDRDWLGQAAEVVAAIERSHSNAMTQPGTIAAIERGDRSMRMFALRAGIDQVVETDEPGELAERVADFVLQRRRSAFRVLIVEDDRGQALFAQKVLGHRGIETRIAESAEQALEIVDAFRPDLCLLDVNLPDRNGIELAQLLREKPGFDLVQIVFLTGELSPDAHMLALRLGADDWICKPVRPRDLITVIESRAGRARRWQARDDAASLGRESARGLHARQRLVGAIARSIASADAGVLVAVAPALAPQQIPGLGWAQQAALGGELVLALRTEGLVRSEVCQAETLCCIFLADPAAASVVALGAIGSALERRHWLAQGANLRLDFALAGLQIDRSQTPDEAIGSLLILLEQARAEAPRIRLKAQPSSRSEQAGWAALSEGFAHNAFARMARVVYHPLMPVRGKTGARFLLRAEFTVTLDDGSPAQPDHRAFARVNGQSLKLDQWTLARCLDRLRMSRDGLALVAEVEGDSIADPRLAAWLQTELQRRRITEPDLMLWVSPDRLRQSPAAAADWLRPFVEMGLRIAVGPLGESPSDLALAGLDAVQCVVTRASAEAPAPLPALAGAAETAGKQILVEGVDEPAVASSLFRSAVHYIVGGAISPPLVRPEFDFPTE